MTAYSYDATTDAWLARTRVFTDAAGGYSLSGLAPGTYRVGFDHVDHVAEFWHDTATLAGATKVTVGYSATVSGVSAQLAGVPISTTSVPTVSGQAVVGGTLTATTGAWKPGTGFTYGYAWLADGSPIPGATGAQYQPVTGDLGKRISVRVTASRGSETPGTATSSQTAPVQQLVVANVAPPQVTGDVQVGRTLTATTGSWTPADGLTFSYQWFVAGTEVPGATTDGFTLRPGDEGDAVTVRVTAAKPLHTAATATSAATGPVALGTLASTSDPVITGTPAVGGTLQLVPGGWSPSDAEVTYEWYVGGVLVEGATGTTYSPVEADIDSTVFALVHASRAGYEPASRTTAGTGAVTLPTLSMTAAPTLLGEPEVGGTLTATTGSWSPADELDFTYTWTAGTDVRAEGPDNTYSPTVADAGRPIAVHVTASRLGFAPTTESAPTTPTAYLPTANTVAPRVTGTAQVGQRLTAAVGTWSPTGLTYGYQWLLDGAPVVGQTASTFTVPPTALNRTVSVRVTGSGSGPAVVVTSLPTAKVKAGALRLVKAPTVTGIAKIGKTLRGTAGSVSPAATKVTYVWLRNGKAIRGATRATYKLVAADRGRKISLKVTYVAVGYTALSATSKALTAR